MKKYIQSMIASACALVLAGCATKPPAVKNYAVFPAPPDEARIQYLTSFGSETELGGQSKLAAFIVGRDQSVHRPITKPYGITHAPGKLYVCDTQGLNVSLIDLTRRQLRYLRPTGQATLGVPTGVAVDNDGTLYITDTKRQQVLMFDKNRQYLGELGAKDEMKPCGIKLTADKLYLTDLKNHCVRVYKKSDRQLLFTIPRNPGETNAVLRSPTNIDVDEAGHIYVSDTGGFCIQIYDAEGKHLRTIGELGLSAGQFALPKGIAVDRQGITYVVDAATTVVQMFDQEGRLLMFFGEPKTSGEAALYLPAGITIDYDNVALYQKYAVPGAKFDYLIWVTNQAGPNKVSVYGFLSKK